MKPIPSRHFGADSNSISIRFHNGNSFVDGYIVKQMGMKDYLVTDGTLVKKISLAPTLAASRVVNGNDTVPDLSPYLSLAVIKIIVNGVSHFVKNLSYNKAALFDGTSVVWSRSDDAANIVGRVKDVVGFALPETLAINFGAKTRVGFGEADLQYTGAGALSIASGDPTGHWQITSRNRIAPRNGGVTTYGSAPPVFVGPYTLVVTDGTSDCTLTINILPNSAHLCAVNTGENADFTYGSGTNSRGHQFQTYLSSATILSLGDTIWCRSHSEFMTDPAYLQSLGLGITTTTPQVRPPAGLYAGVGRITIRSEDPDISVDTNGVPNRRHGFKLGKLLLDGSLSGGVALPFDFKDIHFLKKTTSSTGPFIQYSSNVFGCDHDNNRYETSNITVEGGPYPEAYTRANFLMDGIIESGNGSRRVNITNNTFFEVGKCITSAGYANIRGNYGAELLEDFIFISGTEFTIEDNFAHNRQPTLDPGQHPDFIQARGATGIVSNVIVRRNVFVRGDSFAGQADVQGIFFDDSPPAQTMPGVEVSNNIVINSYGNGVFMNQALDVVIQRNTILTDYRAIDTVPGVNAARILSGNGVKASTRGTIALNVANVVDVSSFVGATVSTPNSQIALGSAAATAAAYALAMPAFTTSINSIAQAKAACTPANLAVASGGLKNPDNTYNGAIGPDGDWNTSTPSGVVPGIVATTFATAPSVQYHANAQAGVVTKSGNQITACPDIRGLAALSGLAIDGTTVIGPVEMTDALGRKFWRFTKSQVAFIANTLNALDVRGITVLMTARVHKAEAYTFFSPRYSAYTDNTTNTPLILGSATVRTNASSGSARMFNATRDSFTDVTNGYKMVPGSQMQVFGVSSRTGAGTGPTRFHHNTDTADQTQTTSPFPTCTGGVIGGSPAASNGFTASAGMDLYEFALWKGQLSNAAADAAAAAMVANFAISAVDGQFALEGDSITNGVPTALPVNPTSADNIAMYLTQPGAPLIPANYRVLNLSVSGASVSSLVGRRDAVSSLMARPYPGGPSKNRVSVHIGRNNWDGTLQNGTNTYNEIVALLNTTTTGYLQRGWSVTQAINIATGGQSPSWTQQRLLLRDPQFLTDTLSGSEQTYNGLVTRLELPLITVGGVSPFNTAANVSNIAAGFMDNDATHPVTAGILAMATGGDTPQYGYGSIL